MHVTKNRRLAGAVASIVLGAGVLSSASAPAQAVTGDRWTGCTTGAGCEMGIWTNQCTQSSSFYLSVLDELSDEYYQFAFVGSGCTIGARHRMVNSTGTGYYYTQWEGRTNSDSRGKTYGLGPFKAKKRCFSEWSVRRSDNSFYVRYHYSKRFLDSRTFREICTDA